MEPDNLELLLTELDTIQTTKPVFLKLSPDYGYDIVDRLLDVAHAHRVHGIICTNLIKKRDPQKLHDENIPAVGGISGKPVQDASDALLAHIYSREHAREKPFILIGLGGVFSAADAYKKIRLGANLVQLITGMIFEGPQLIGEINRSLATFLARDGFLNVSDAVGIDNKD